MGRRSGRGAVRVHAGPVAQQVLGVDLELFKHHEDGGVGDVVHAAVEEVHVPAVPGGGPAVVGVALGVASHQNPAHEHGLEVGVPGVAVRVFGVPGEVAPLAEHRPVDATQPPVEVAEADDMDVFGVGAVEELLLRHGASPVVHLHLSLLPLEDLPEGFVLNPLDLNDVEASQRSAEQRLQILELSGGAQEGNSLEHKETRRNTKKQEETPLLFSPCRTSCYLHVQHSVMTVFINSIRIPLVFDLLIYNLLFIIIRMMTIII